MNQGDSKDIGERPGEDAAEESGKKTGGEIAEDDAEEADPFYWPTMEEPRGSEPIWVALMILVTLAPVIVAIGLLLLELSAHIDAVLHRALASH